MKKILYFLLAFCCLFGLIGCAAEQAEPKNSVTVYYRRAKLTYGAEDSVITGIRMDTGGRAKDYTYLLTQYLQSSPGEDLADTFPADLTIYSFQLEALTAKVVLNARIADFSGMDLTIALTCLVKTVMSITGCQEVIISANGTQLDGQDFVTLSKDSFLLLDDSGISQN